MIVVNEHTFRSERGRIYEHTHAGSVTVLLKAHPQRISLSLCVYVWLRMFSKAYFPNQTMASHMCVCGTAKDAKTYTNHLPTLCPAHIQFARYTHISRKWAHRARSCSRIVFYCSHTHAHTLTRSLTHHSTGWCGLFLHILPLSMRSCLWCDVEAFLAGPRPRGFGVNVCVLASVLGWCKG